jgi:transposase InsO family protein
MHRRPRLNFSARQLIISRLDEGLSPSWVAESMGVSRATVYKWARRHRLEGESGLEDRKSRPHSSPRRLAPEAELPVLELRRTRRLGPHRLSMLLGMPRSTCYKVLRRHQLHRLDWLDRPTGRLIRRYEMSQPGELGHMDVKKLARIPEGGGHRAHGRLGRPRGDYEKGFRIGYECLHSLIDDYSRVAYSELLDDEKAVTVGGFFRRALAWFGERNVHFQAVMTDNAWAYRNGNDYHRALAEIGAKAIFTRPYTPRTNGKVERYNRTMLEEWVFALPLHRSQEERRSSLSDWVHRYNYHRNHTAVGGPPIQRVNDVCGNYSSAGRRALNQDPSITRGRGPRSLRDRRAW